MVLHSWSEGMRGQNKGQQGHQGSRLLPALSSLACDICSCDHGMAAPPLSFALGRKIELKIEAS